MASGSGGSLCPSSQSDFISCVFCSNEQLLDPESLKPHISSAHMNYLPARCTVCNDRLPLDENFLKIHGVQRHEEQWKAKRWKIYAKKKDPLKEAELQYLCAIAQAPSEQEVWSLNEKFQTAGDSLIDNLVLDTVVSSSGQPVEPKSEPKIAKDSHVFVDSIDFLAENAGKIPKKPKTAGNISEKCKLQTKTAQSGPISINLIDLTEETGQETFENLKSSESLPIKRVKDDPTEISEISSESPLAMRKSPVDEISWRRSLRSASSSSANPIDTKSYSNTSGRFISDTKNSLNPVNNINLGDQDNKDNLKIDWRSSILSREESRDQTYEISAVLPISALTINCTDSRKIGLNSPHEKVSKNRDFLSPVEKKRVGLVMGSVFDCLIDSSIGSVLSGKGSGRKAVNDGHDNDSATSSRYEEVGISSMPTDENGNDNGTGKGVESYAPDPRDVCAECQEKLGVVMICPGLDEKQKHVDLHFEFLKDVPDRESAIWMETFKACFLVSGLEQQLHLSCEAGYNPTPEKQKKERQKVKQKENEGMLLLSPKSIKSKYKSGSLKEKRDFLSQKTKRASQYCVKCDQCGKKGLTPLGLKLHKIKKHGFPTAAEDSNRCSKLQRKLQEVSDSKISWNGQEGLFSPSHNQTPSSSRDWPESPSVLSKGTSKKRGRSSVEEIHKSSTKKCRKITSSVQRAAVLVHHETEQDAKKTEGRHECSFCEQSFSTIDDLLSHEKTHFGELD